MTDDLDALNTSYFLNEDFWTIQGEGEKAGHTAVFLRLQGCPVGCAWCDSKLTWYAGGERKTVSELCRIVAEYPSSASIVITGGEPLIYSLDHLFIGLRIKFPHRLLQLETSGAYPFKGVCRPDWTTLSPKAAAKWKVWDNVLKWADELKYVVDEVYDPLITVRHLQHFQSLAPEAQVPLVRLMPEGAPPRVEMVEKTLAILTEFPQWRFGPRLQYAYLSITTLEGVNNKIVTVEEARRQAKKLREDRQGKRR